MFKSIYFCALALSLCSAPGPEAWKEKFDNQYTYEDKKPCDLTMEALKKEWEKCKDKKVSTQKDIFLDGVSQKFDIIRTDIIKTYKRTEMRDNIIRLCFAIGQDGSVYYIEETTHPGDTPFDVPEYSYGIVTKQAREAKNSKALAEYRARPDASKFKIYDTDGQTELKPDFSNNLNNAEMKVALLPNGWDILTRDQFLELIIKYDYYKGNGLRNSKRVIKNPPIDLVPSSNPFSYEIWFQLAQTG